MLTKDQIIEALKTVKDPEVGYDIVTMGLIYDIEIKEQTTAGAGPRLKAVGLRKKDQRSSSAKATAGTEVKILMTYTTPFCPWGPQLNDEVTTVLKDNLGIKKVDIEITFDPPYKMPEELRTVLGI